jgi:predicted PurR-regulated permease PerM
MSSSDHKHTTVTFTNRTIIRVVIVVAFSFLVLRFLDNIAHPLTLIFTAAFLALALNPAVSWIAKRLKSKSRVRATGVAYLIVLALLIAFLAIVIPPLVKQTASFISNLPANIENIKNNDSALVHFINDHNLQPHLDKLANQVKNNIDDIGKSAVTTATKVGGAFVSTLTVLVMTFMMLVEGPIWLEKLWAMQDPARVKKRKRAAERMYRVVTGYVNGQLIIAFIAGMFSLVVMLIASTLLDVSINAVVYASIVTIIGLIPMIGNTIAAIIVVLLCALSSLPLAIIMLIFFIVYQQVENVTLQPYIQAKHNELTPLLVFIAALVGIGFGGLLGAFIAIPAAGCLKVFLTEFYGDRLAHGKVTLADES